LHMTNNVSVQADRNLKAALYEKQGKMDKAIELYLKNVNERFDGNYPYDRLCVIYRKQKRYQEELEVLKTAIFVFENIVYSERGDRETKLIKFVKRLNTVRKLIK